MSSAVRLRFCGVAVLLMTFAAEPCSAGFVSALEKFTVKYTGTAPASAFSIVVNGIKETDIATKKSDKFPFFRFIGEAKGLRITFRDDASPIMPGDSITVTMTFNFVDAMGKPANLALIPIKVIRGESGFNDSIANGNGPLKINPVIPGLKATGDPIYNVLNDSESSGLDLRDLQLLANVAQIDPDTLDPLDSTTFGTPIGAVMLSAGLDVSSRDFDTGVVAPGNWFYVRGQIYDENGDHVGAFIQGFRAQVPEPGSAVLLSLGLAVLGGGGYARRKQAWAMGR